LHGFIPENKTKNYLKGVDKIEGGKPKLPPTLRLIMHFWWNQEKFWCSGDRGCLGESEPLKSISLPVGLPSFKLDLRLPCKY